MSETHEPATGGASSLGGKYLTLQLEETQYGIIITKIREIIRMTKVTEVPRTPDFVRGILNLRGRIVPIVDLRPILDLPRVEDTDLTRIIVVELESTQTGVIVDGVTEVVEIEPDRIEESPEFGPDVHTEFILGVAKGEEGMILLLDVEAALTRRQKETLAEIADAA